MNPISNAATAIAPVAAPAPDAGSAGVVAQLAQAVMVGEGMEANLRQTLEGIGREGDVSAQELLKLQLQNAGLSAWMGTVGGISASYYALLKDAVPR